MDSEKRWYMTQSPGIDHVHVTRTKPDDATELVRTFSPVAPKSELSQKIDAGFMVCPEFGEDHDSSILNQVASFKDSNENKSESV